MMVMASLMLLLGCGVTLLGYTSAQTDRKEMQKYVDAEMQSLPVSTKFNSTVSYLTLLKRHSYDNVYIIWIQNESTRNTAFIF